MEDNDVEFVIRPHARRRMLERRIPEAALAAVLSQPLERRPARRLTGSAAADLVIGEFEGRRLRIYVVPLAYPFIVRSAAWDEPEHDW